MLEPEKIVAEITAEEQKAQEASEEILSKIVDSLRDNGKLIITALGGHGKSNLAMHLVRYLMTRPDYKNGKCAIRITDSTNVWRWKFDSVPVIDVTKTQYMPENESALLLDLGFSNPDRNTAIIENLMRGDYIKQRELITQNHGEIPLYKIFIIEEAQCVWGSYSMNGNQGKFFLKLMSEGRNYGLYTIGITQRLADLSTKFVERSRYFLLGAISGDNDSQKLKRMFNKERGQRIVNTLLGLQKSEFLWLDKENPEQSFKIRFPLFVQSGKPYEYGQKRNNNKIEVERVFL